MDRREQNEPKYHSSRRGTISIQPLGERLQIRMPDHLVKGAITVFQSHPHDQRILDLTHRMRRLCRRILGISNDADAEKVILDALKKLPRQRDSYDFNGRILKINRLRNQIVHEDKHATPADVEATEAAWRELKARACAFLGIPNPPTTEIAPTPVEDSSVDKSAPRTLWARVVNLAEKGVPQWRESMEGLLEQYESAILDIFNKRARGNHDAAKAQCSAFCQSLRALDTLANPGIYTSFREFLANAIMDHVRGQAQGDAAELELDRESVLRRLTALRARQLYISAIDDARDTCEQTSGGEEIRGLLDRLAKGTLSLEGMRCSGQHGREAFHTFRTALCQKVADEVYVPHGRNITTVVDRELVSFFEVLLENAGS